MCLQISSCLPVLSITLMHGSALGFRRPPSCKRVITTEPWRGLTDIDERTSGSVARACRVWRTASLGACERFCPFDSGTVVFVAPSRQNSCHRSPGTPIWRPICGGHRVAAIRGAGLRPAASAFGADVVYLRRWTGTIVPRRKIAKKGRPSGRPCRPEARATADALSKRKYYPYFGSASGSTVAMPFG